MRDSRQGVRALTALDEPRWSRLVCRARHQPRPGFLLFDTASGVSDNVLDVVNLADYVLVVTSADPAAVVDAYAVIKLISANDRVKAVGVVINSTRDAEGGLVFRRISLAAIPRPLAPLRRARARDRSIKDSGSRSAHRPRIVGTGEPHPALACRLIAVRPSGVGPWSPSPPH